MNKENIHYFVLLIICAAGFLLIGRCTMSDHIDTRHYVEAKSIHLEEWEVLIDLASTESYVTVFHEDPLCSAVTSKKLAKVPYSDFRNTRLAPCAYCCKKYGFK